MAIAVNTVNSVNVSSSPVTVSHSTAGSDRLLIVGTTGHTTATISGITYAGTSLTQVDGTVVNSRIGGEMWQLVNPDIDANDVVVTWTGEFFRGAVGIISFTGVDQTTPLGTSGIASGLSASPTVDVSSATGELVVDVLANEGASTVTAGASQTERWNQVNTTEDGLQNSGSTEPGASTVTMSWSITSDDWVIIAVPIKPVAAGFIPYPNPRYTMMGGMQSMNGGN